MSTATVKPFVEVRETLDALVASSRLALRGAGAGPVPAIVNFVHWRVLSYKSKQVAARLEVISQQLQDNCNKYISFDCSRKGFYGLTEEDRKALACTEAQESLESMVGDIAVLRGAFPKIASRMQKSVDASLEACQQIARIVPRSVHTGKSNKPADLLGIEALGDALLGLR